MGGSGASRHLLQSAAESTSAGDQITVWNGYQLAVSDRSRNWAIDETDAPEQARYVGAAPGHNKLVAGLFLHTTRKTRTGSCTGRLVHHRRMLLLVIGLLSSMHLLSTNQLPTTFL